MQLSRASFEFCILMLLGVVLFATSFLILSRPRSAPYARLDAIEARFAPQIERLRELEREEGKLTGLSGPGRSATISAS